MVLLRHPSIDSDMNSLLSSLADAIQRDSLSMPSAAETVHRSQSRVSDIRSEDRTQLLSDGKSDMPGPSHKRHDAVLLRRGLPRCPVVPC